MTPYLELLQFQSGKDPVSSQVIELRDLKTWTIGRSLACDQTIVSPSHRVSRVHLTLTRDGTGWSVSDGNGDRSLNGSTINRAPLTSPCKLRNGDVLEFPTRPIADPQVWRWRLTYRLPQQHETAAGEDTLVQGNGKTQAQRLGKYRGVILLLLLTLTVTLLADAAPEFIDPDQKMSMKEWLELCIGMVTGAGSLAIALGKLLRGSD